MVRLARSLAAQRVTDIIIRVIRGERTDRGAREVRGWKDYRVGYYTGSNGFLSVNDARVAARGISRVLGGTRMI